MASKRMRGLERGGQAACDRVATALSDWTGEECVVRKDGECVGERRAADPSSERVGGGPEVGVRTYMPGDEGLGGSAYVCARREEGADPRFLASRSYFSSVRSSSIPEQYSSCRER
eukprot:2152846-Rhodomonas_salina.1